MLMWPRCLCLLLYVSGGLINPLLRAVAGDLVARMTLEGKAGQLLEIAPAIPAFTSPAYTGGP